MTQTAHLGSSQQPSVAPWDVSVPRLAHYSGLLGNLHAQAPVIVIADFREEELWLGTTLKKRFGAARPASKLAILKQHQFVAEGREQRIGLALAALDAPQPTELTLEQWKAVVEEVEDEDEA